jgi:hypothetical protein
METHSNTYTDPVTGKRYEVKEQYNCGGCAARNDDLLCDRLPCLLDGQQVFIFKLIPTEGEKK